MLYVKEWSLLALLGVLFVTQVRAELIMSAPPRESQEEGRQTYEPLTKYLAEVIGEPISYVQPRDWAQYSTEMRAGKYDIVFDGPHFTAWRIKHLRHVPLAKLPGTLDFVVIVRWDDKRINRLRDLVAMPVCGLPSPNLGTTTIMAQFHNPVTQPDFNEVKGGFVEVMTEFNSKKCRAAVVRDNAFRKLPDEEKKKFKVVYKTQSFPNQTFTVSSRIRPKAREKILAALLVKNALTPASKIFNEFSKSAKFFVAVEPGEFEDLEYLLEGVVWGW